MKPSRAEQNGREYRKLRLMTLGYSIGISLAVVLLIFTVWLQSIRVSDDGMAPVLRQGDIVLFDRLAKHISLPARGDAYAFSSEDALMLGRIVGLPGEHVQIKDGHVYIDGAQLDEARYAVASDLQMEERTLPINAFFLLPDARPLTVLNPEAMTISFDRLVGRAALRVAPWNRISLFIA
ncbi:MAG: signal peptidase I [Christensenellaceae bacterium]|jgi:signal peptidase I|nr:signal peptidase I [Christensenellaceae bacterium]